MYLSDIAISISYFFSVASAFSKEKPEKNNAERHWDTEQENIEESLGLWV